MVHCSYHIIHVIIEHYYGQVFHACNSVGKLTPEEIFWYSLIFKRDYGLKSIRTQYFLSRFNYYIFKALANRGKYLLIGKYRFIYLISDMHLNGSGKCGMVILLSELQLYAERLEYQCDVHILLLVFFQSLI